ncbi:MAG: PadR family transcriptional regulator [Planctomycetes bacterium]|nr:PadR family transcriptional regulator [Planctomycetota bacterium]
MAADRANVPVDLAECPCAGGTLDKLIQPAILVILARGSLHGYRIVEQLGDMKILGGHKPDASGVYRFLKMMETKGLVVSSWDTSQAGPAKRVYQVTASGQSCLCQWITTLEAYRDGITHLLKAARKAVARPHVRPSVVSSR